MTRLIAPLLFIALFSGCAVGVKHRYNDITPETKLQTRAKVAVGVHDQRSYVVSGEKPPTYAGVSRGGYGNPFNVDTESGQPLAKDFQNSIANALARAGATVIKVDLTPTTSRDEAQRLMRDAGGDKALLMTIREWLVDTYVNVNFRYHLLLSVLDKTGKSLALKELRGEEKIGESLMNPVGASQEAAPVAYKKKLEEMLSDPAIAKALQ